MLTTGSLSWAVFLLVAGATLTSCTGTSPPEPQPTPSSSAHHQQRPVTLRFAVYGDPAAVASYQKIATTYTEAHPKVTIRVSHTRDAASAERRLATQLQDRDAPDLFLVDRQALPGLVAAGDVRPVAELLEARHVQFGDDFQRIGLEGFSADSALQCMPNDVSPLVVFYNTRLLRFRALVPPGQPAPTPDLGWTWDQFTAAAEMLTGGGVKGVYAPPDLGTLLPLVRSAGADLVDSARTPTTLTFADGGARSALERVLTLLRNPRLSPTPGELRTQGAVSRFEHGRIGMLIGTRALVPRLRTAHGLSFDVFPLPSLGSAQTTVQMTGLCISPDSAHVPATADFLAYAVGAHGAAINAASDEVVPANLDALHSSSFSQPGTQPSHVDVFELSARTASAAPFTPKWPAVLAGTRSLVRRLFYAPVVNLDRLLPRIDRVSRPILSVPTPSPSSSPSTG
jgi:multiple sugar transport system substrate-binding protein